MKKFFLSTAIVALSIVGAQAQNQVKKVEAPATEQQTATPATQQTTTDTVQPFSNTAKPSDGVQNAQPDPNATAQPAPAAEPAK